MKGNKYGDLKKNHRTCYIPKCCIFKTVSTPSAVYFAKWKNEALFVLFKKNQHAMKFTEFM